MAKKLIVTQDAEKPVPVEVLAACISSIAEGVRRLRAGRLNERALILLIQHAAPTIPNGAYGKRAPTAKEVRAILDGIDNLEREYLKPSPK